MKDNIKLKDYLEKSIDEANKDLVDNINNPNCQYKKEYARLMLRMKLMNDIIPQHNNNGKKCDCHN